MTTFELPTGFVLGVATSAYQIEGNALGDGKGPSIWDTFTNLPGTTVGDIAGDRGVDHYDRYKEDVRHLRELGVDSYRFSLSWPRILPEGTGRVNEKGLEFYDRLIDELLANDIAPNVTLYHWDLPQALQDRGGWPNRDIVDWFAEYAEVTFDRFGDRVPMWATLNEPISVWVGYGMGLFAPGIQDARQGKQAMHNAMLAHGRAVEVFRRSDAIGKIGVVVDVWKRHPATDSEPDHDIALRDEEDTFRFFFDELFAGGLNDHIVERLERDGTMPEVHDGDAALAGTPIDYFGVNVYSRVVVSAENHTDEWWASGEPRLSGGNYLENGKELYPRALSDAVALLRDEYNVKVPVYITENGLAIQNEEPGEDGQVHDSDRITYIKSFLANAIDADAHGLDVRGYYAWSLMDNFEWTSAYTQRFGLLRVDLETMERTWKESAFWYQDACRTRRFELDMPNTLGRTQVSSDRVGGEPS